MTYLWSRPRFVSMERSPVGPRDEQDRRMTRVYQWTSTDLLSELDRFRLECVKAGMSPNSVHSYWDYARRFLSWREGDYRPRGASGPGRRPAVGTASTADLANEADEYARELASAGLRQTAIDTYHRHAMFFVRWLDGEYAPGGRLMMSKTKLAKSDDRMTAAWVLEHALDVSFGELLPWLERRREEPIDAHSAISTRLSNVLARWRGTKWGPYVAATPREFMERRNAGRGSLEAFFGAATAAEGQPPIAPDGTQHLPETVPPKAEPRSGVDDEDVTVPLRTIIAWGALERGREDLSEILSLAQEDPDVPADVADAIARLRACDWRDWVSSLQARFDPSIPLRDFIDALGGEDLAIVRERLVAVGRRSTLDELAQRRNVTRERIRQIESRLAKRLHSLASIHAALARAIRRVREDIGLAMLLAHLPQARGLADLRLASLDGDESRLLLWLAGPYDKVGEWLVRRPAQQAVEATRSALRRLTEEGPAAVSDIETDLMGMGLVSSELSEWIVSVGGFRINDDKVTRWGGVDGRQGRGRAAPQRSTPRSRRTRIAPRTRNELAVHDKPALRRCEVQADGRPPYRVGRVGSRQIHRSRRRNRPGDRAPRWRGSTRRPHLARLHDLWGFRRECSRLRLRSAV